MEHATVIFPTIGTSVWRPHVTRRPSDGDHGNIESIILTWNPSKKEYTISALTADSGLLVKYAKDIHEAVSIINEIEDKHAA